MESVTLGQIVAATRGRAVRLEDQYLACQRVVTDSRLVEAGDLFWALPGENHDGHDFVADAEARGAVACVVSVGNPIQSTGPLIEVDESRNALGQFASWYRLQRDALVVGVTGSVGKTTTREMIHAALTGDYEGIRSQKNFNNEIGLPLTLLDINSHHDFAILELGARRIGDIRQLVEIAQPEIGVITRIAPCHLETFGSIEGILSGKGELFEALPKSGFAVLGGDDEVTRTLAKRAACPVLLVGQASHNQIKAAHVDVAYNKLRFKVGNQNYEIAVTGRHYLVSALSAIAVAREIGLAPDDIARGLKSFQAVDGRCEVERIGDWTVINDTYNASPASMQAACELLADWQQTTRRILVAGDMLELGSNSADFHRDLGQCAARTQLDVLLAYGPHADNIVAGALAAGFSPYQIATCRDWDALLTVLDCYLVPETTVLVKGSRGMRMERVVEWLKTQAGGYQPHPLKKVA